MAMKPHLQNLVKRFTTPADQKATTIADTVGDLQKPDASALGPQQKATIEKATFGAGCFWGTEKFFRKQFGGSLLSTAVGYSGGNLQNPTYREVCEGNTGHAEVLQLEYDKSSIDYSDLVRFFFRMHDPTTPNRQGNDRGTQYRSVIFYHTPEQKEKAERVKEEVQKRYPNTQIATEISPASQFFKAESNHQQYLEKNPGGYCNHWIRW